MSDALTILSIAAGIHSLWASWRIGRLEQELAPFRRIATLEQWERLTRLVTARLELFSMRVEAEGRTGRWLDLIQGCRRRPYTVGELLTVQEPSQVEPLPVWVRMIIKLKSLISSHLNFF